MRITPPCLALSFLPFEGLALVTSTGAQEPTFPATEIFAGG